MKLLNGDSAVILKDIPDCSVDLTVTSPPYDDLREYKGYSFDFETIAKELFRVTKPGGVVIWIVSDATKSGSETGTSFRQALYFKEIGFNLHDTMIWVKDTLTFPDPTRYGQTFEYMFVFSKGKPKTFNPIKDKPNKWAGEIVHGTSRGVDGKTFRKSNHHKGVTQEYGVRYNVWNMPGEKHNDTGHPAVFPVKLAKDHILSWSNKGDTVLDPFMGSGTTGIACADTGRDFIGIEISKDFYELSKRRTTEASAQVRMDI